MPLFEYSCKKCGTDFEELVRDDTIVKCPECGSKKTDKKLSTFSAQDGGKSSPCEGGQCPMSGGGCCPGGACGLH